MMFMLELPVQRTWQLTVAKDFNKAGKQGFVKFRAMTSGPIVEKNVFNTQVLCNARLTLLDLFHKPFYLLLQDLKEFFTTV